MSGHKPIVYVVQTDHSKNFENARRFGELRAIHANPRKPYDTTLIIEQTRAALEDIREEDYILMVGDPMLCAVAVAVAAELQPVVQILSWDRMSFRYNDFQWNFGLEGEYE